MENPAPGYETLRMAARTAAAEGHAGAAQAIYRRVIAMVEKQLGRNSVEYAASMHEFAEVLAECHEWLQSEQAYKESMSLYRQLIPADDHRFALLFRGLADVCRQLGNEAEAREYERQAGMLLGDRLGVERNACLD